MATVRFALAGATAIAGPAAAQDGVRPIATGLEITLPAGVLTVEPWSDRIVHVRFGPRGFAGNYNPAVIATRAAPRFTRTATATAAVIETAALRVSVERATGAVTFADRAGHVLLAEGARSLAAGAISQAFATRTPIYGLGQHQDGLLDYSGNSIHLQQKNGDVAVPMMVSPVGFGILWNNASVMDVDVAVPGAAAPLVVRNDAGGIDYDFILGPEPDRVIAGYRWLTGTAPMMPRWSWGFWQSREHYETQGQLESVVTTYRAMGVPLDAVVVDWQHWRPGEWGAHRFDPARWPEPAGMIRTLGDRHVHVPISVWAKFDLGTANEAALAKAGALFDPIYTNVYPAGRARWYDAWNPEGRRLYWDQIRTSYGSEGFRAWWLDASEPELGGRWGELRDLPTAAGPGRVVFNSYPLMHTMAVHDGMRRDYPDQRVMILTRSAYAGQQRNGAMTWSGDTGGDWETFRKQVPAALNFALSGIPYWSADVGGFFGKDPHDPAYAELFTRWLQFALFSTQMRVHGTAWGKEIWNYDGPVQPRLIELVKWRYRLMPYLYAIGWNATAAGGTPMRALAFDFRDDPEALRRGDEYMFGPALLVAPVLTPGAISRDVYLPAGGWFDFWTGRRVAGGRSIAAAAPIETIPVFARAGSIVPVGPVIPYADAAPDAPVELRVYPGRDGAFTLYDDAGDGYGYQRGERSLVALLWDDHARRLSFAARDGGFPGMRAAADFRIVCGAGGGAAGPVIRYTGAAVSVPLAGCR